MSKKVDLDKLIEELEKRRQEVYNNQTSKGLQTPTTLKTGAVLGLNDAIVLIKKLGKEEEKK
jgi:hypothetical protein